MRRRGGVLLAVPALLAAATLTGVLVGGGDDEVLVPDDSMAMTIAQGSSVPTEPVTDYRGRRGDVVVLRGVWGRSADSVVVARVVGLGGENVRCCDDQGRTLVDETPLREGYVYLAPGQGSRQRPWPAVQVPPGSLWVLGDNRNAATDSRAAGNGPVPEDSVVAVLTGAAADCPPAAASCTSVTQLTHDHGGR